jgi:predicted glycogen debranching enzyme
LSIQFNRSTFDELAAMEWLVTNGIGGFAGGTLSGANTRRYHGLLVAAVVPPTHRRVLVSKMEETIVRTDGGRVELSANEYPGAIHPTGFQFLTEFEIGPIPTFTYEAEQSKLVKRIFMPQGSNCTIVQYQNIGEAALDLEVRLFLNYRDYHHLTREDDRFIYTLQWSDERSGSVHEIEGIAQLFFRFTNGAFVEHRDWYRQFIYRKETYRGLDNVEDLFTPGYVTCKIEPQHDFFICFSTEAAMIAKDPEVLMDIELSRITAIKKEARNSALGKALPPYVSIPGYNAQQIFEDLCVAADQFIVKRGQDEGKTIIAGYHWFTDWGRDTMIAMRGLVIARGHKALAENIVRTFLQYLDQGMIPNRFPDFGEEPEYNTIDATLWLFVVLHEYAEQFGDYDFIHTVFDSLTSIIEHHLAGTRYNIHMLDNGLLYGGEDGVQLTWMDAKVGDYVVTPRIGCAVEINALWYNALRIYNALAEQCNRETPYVSLSEKVKSSFHQYFFNGTHLHDVIIPGEFADDAIRPNQIYAISLPYALLSIDEGQMIIEIVRNKLATPYGLRSLDPAHPDFIGIYKGDQLSRDKAYHQGTVWSYLIGEYWLALLKQANYSAEAKKKVVDDMKPLLQHFYQEDCIHGINEIFDGLEPKEGRGCVHQAWSVGMMIRVISELVIE